MSTTAFWWSIFNERQHPDVYAYRIRKRITHWYLALRELEHELNISMSQDERDRMTTQLDIIEAKILADNIPAMNSEAFYTLRASIDLIRDRLGRPDAKTLSERGARIVTSAST